MTKAKSKRRDKAEERLREYAHSMLHTYRNDNGSFEWRSNDDCNGESVGLDMMRCIDLLANDARRVDELEAGKADTWLKGFSKAREVITAFPEMFGFMRSPVDANGERIIVGDLIYDEQREIIGRVTEISSRRSLP